MPHVSEWVYKVCVAALDHNRESNVDRFIIFHKIRIETRVSVNLYSRRFRWKVVDKYDDFTRRTISTTIITSHFHMPNIPANNGIHSNDLSADARYLNDTKTNNVISGFIRSIDQNTRCSMAIVHQIGIEQKMTQQKTLVRGVRRRSTSIITSVHSTSPLIKSKSFGHNKILRRREMKTWKIIAISSSEYLLPGHCVYLIRVERILIHEARRATEAHFGIIFQAIVSRWSSPDKMCATDLTSPNCRHNSRDSLFVFISTNCDARNVLLCERTNAFSQTTLDCVNYFILFLGHFYCPVISIVAIWIVEENKMLRETN